MKLIKFGLSDSGGLMGWADANDHFNEFRIVDLYQSTLPSKFGISYTPLVKNRIEYFFVFNLRRAIRIFRSNKLIVFICVLILKLYYKKTVRTILSEGYDHFHCSYNDFEDGSLTFLLFKNEILKNGGTYTVAYKETRPEINWIEREVFRKASRVILNCEENLQFFSSKYPEINFNEKEVLFELDEDWRTKKAFESKIDIQKLSQSDNKAHVAILAGRVLPNLEEKRSGARLYYLDLIKDLINAGNVVHLHTFKLVKDKNGKEPYTGLRDLHPDQFFIENALDQTDIISFYSTLSRYDFGVLHMFADDADVSIFDAYNVPNRFFHYQIARVIPIQKLGTKPILEKYYPKSTYFYAEISEINLELAKATKFEWIHKNFADYLNCVYPKSLH